MVIFSWSYNKRHETLSKAYHWQITESNYSPLRDKRSEKYESTESC